MFRIAAIGAFRFRVFRLLSAYYGLFKSYLHAASPKNHRE
jgi:hypothetical protein